MQSYKFYFLQRKCNFIITGRLSILNEIILFLTLDGAASMNNITYGH